MNTISAAKMPSPVISIAVVKRGLRRCKRLMYLGYSYRGRFLKVRPPKQMGWMAAAHGIEVSRCDCCQAITSKPTPSAFLSITTFASRWPHQPALQRDCSSLPTEGRPHMGLAFRNVQRAWISALQSGCRAGPA